MTDEEINMTIKESWLKDMVDTHNKYKKLETENQQLKELLGDCKRRIEDAFYTSEGDKWLAKTTIEEIDNAIGGKK